MLQRRRTAGGRSSMPGSAQNGRINLRTNMRTFAHTTESLNYWMSGEQGRVLLLSRSTLHYSYSIPVSTVNPPFSLHRFSGLCISGEPTGPPFCLCNRASDVQKWPLLAVTVCPFTPSPEYSKNFKNLTGGIASHTAFDLSYTGIVAHWARGRKGNGKALLGLFSYVGLLLWTRWEEGADNTLAIAR